MMRETGIIPSHVIPAHRALINGCPECSSSDLKTAFREVDNRQSALQELETLLASCIIGDQSLKSIFPCVMRKTWEIIDLMPLLLNVVTCQLKREVCYESSDLTNNPGLANLLIQAKRVRSLVGLVLLPYGGAIPGDELNLLSSYGDSFNSTLASLFSNELVLSLADSSAGGEFLTLAELETLQSMGNNSLPRDSDIAIFAETWNRSLTLWDDGIYSADELPSNFTSSFFDLDEAEKYKSAFLTARTNIASESYAGFGDAWLTAVEGQQLEEAKQLAGVCALVRVKIKQELTMTRIGFEASLEIWNDGDNLLENVTVTLRVSPFGNTSDDSTSLFVFGEPELTDVTSISGGVIDANSNAKATWLILPLTEAAPIFEAKYDVSGVLRYTIEGVWYTQPLASDTITVQPDPQLYLKYFHSREVFSDDPFTTQVEVSVPYQLGLLIENRGYGDAFDVNILSSQPEIVENDKGLLIDFTIIGSRLNDAITRTKSLNIDFGTVAARSNSIGVWDMVSTLRGTFNNFSATFEYKGPINDDRLSLIESVEIYELSHIVQVDGNHPSAHGLGYIDDGIGDFLANLNPDFAYIPDHVFTSDTRQSNFTVASAIDKLHPVSVNKTNDDEMVVIVQRNMTPEEIGLLTDWVYIRFDNVLAGSGFALEKVIRTDVDYTLVPSFNSWQTAWTDYLLSGDIEENNHIHLFDFGVAFEYHLIYCKPVAVTNIKVLDSSESEITIGWESQENISPSYILIKNANLGDQYFKIAKSYLPEDVTTVKIRSLSPGTAYSILVMPAGHNQDENVGTMIEGTTTGTSLCGNGQIDIGEDCDEGNDNGRDGFNCTTACVIRISGSESALPSSTPSESPLTSPSTSPSASPSASPISNPSSSPSASATESCYPKASKIRLISTTGDYLHLFEFVAKDPSNADLTTNKTATQSSTFSNNFVKYGPANAVDGDAVSFIHTNKGDADPNPVWTVELGLNSEVSLIEIKNRYCGDMNDAPNCLGRLSHATVELLDSDDNVVDSKSFGDTSRVLDLNLDFNTCATSSPLATPSNSPSVSHSASPSASPRSSPSSSPSASATESCYPKASKIRLISTTGDYLHLFEFVAKDPSNADLTTNKTATQSSTFSNNFVKYGPANAVDGDAVSFIHTNKGDADPNPVWTVELGLNSEVSLIEIKNRYCGDMNDAPNCLGRLSHATVELLDSDDNVVDSKSFGDTSRVLDLNLDFNTCATSSRSASL